jgi:hypothetical protein
MSRAPIWTGVKPRCAAHLAAWKYDPERFGTGRSHWWLPFANSSLTADYLLIEPKEIRSLLVNVAALACNGSLVGLLKPGWFRI